jgi:DNA-binding MarR family transcriptional regulator
MRCSIEPTFHRWLFAINRSRLAFLRERFGALDVEPRLLPLVYRLHGAIGVRQEDLSLETGLDKSTVAHAVKRLMELGYLERTQCCDDKRSYHLELTQKATALVPSIALAMTEWNAALARGFSDDERSQLESYLKRMAGSAEAACGRPKAES